MRKFLPLLFTAVLISGCSTASSPHGAGGTLAGTPAKGLTSFYAVPATLPSSTPGTLIKDKKIKETGIIGTAYRVMYVSEDTAGKPIAVTGLVFVPPTKPPKGGYPVITWGHGTNGMAPQCAPSLHPATAVPFPNSLLRQGWEVVASDYQGEGTPGPLPYLVGVLAARNTIDIVRAAHALALAHASTTYAVWGHSEGGQTALFALHIAASYDKGLHLVGVVAGAPPSNFSVVYTFLKTSPYRFYLFMAALGFHTAYGKSAPLTAVLTPKAFKYLPLLTEGCATSVQKHVDAVAKTITGFVKANPFDVPSWKKLLTENDPGSFTSSAPYPLLIPQGGADTQIPPISTTILTKHYCAIHQSVQRWLYPGKSHAGVIPYYLGDMIHWLTDRFAGRSLPDAYHPTGVPGVTVTNCQ